VDLSIGFTLQQIGSSFREAEESYESAYVVFEELLGASHPRAQEALTVLNAVRNAMAFDEIPLPVDEFTVDAAMRRLQARARAEGVEIVSEACYVAVLALVEEAGPAADITVKLLMSELPEHTADVAALANQIYEDECGGAPRERGARGALGARAGVRGAREGGVALDAARGRGVGRGRGGARGRFSLGAYDDSAEVALAEAERAARAAERKRAAIEEQELQRALKRAAKPKARVVMTEGGGMIVQRRDSIDSIDGDLLDELDRGGSPTLGGRGAGGAAALGAAQAALLLAAGAGAALDGTAGEHALPLEVVRAQARA